jgi:hypothetical protein
LIIPVYKKGTISGVFTWREKAFRADVFRHALSAFAKQFQIGWDLIFPVYKKGAISGGMENWQPRFLQTSRR